MSKKKIKSRFGTRLLAAAKEARIIARGKAAPNTYRVHEPADVSVREIRREPGLTQEEFATRFGLPIGKIRDLEKHRRQPDGRRLSHFITY
jgi:putative transcriptional regulator